VITTPSPAPQPSAYGLRGLVLDHGGVLESVVDVVQRARDAGVRTALLSNAERAPEPAVGRLFDTVVVSGMVGMSKPDPGIYRLTADRLDLVPSECVFVDDLVANVRGAAAVGMVGVHHIDAQSTVDELATLLGIPLDG
jgi:epoxide hydrolase-like predicted phosphatase